MRVRGGLWREGGQGRQVGGIVGEGEFGIFVSLCVSVGVFLTCCPMLVSQCIVSVSDL